MAERVIFADISPRAWEHPTDRAALNGLRRLPGFDIALRRIYAILGERSVRLLFKANAIQVSAEQYPVLHAALLRVCETLDVDPIPELYVSQTPLVNAAMASRLPPRSQRWSVNNRPKRTGGTNESVSRSVAVITVQVIGTRDRDLEHLHCVLRPTRARRRRLTR